MALASDEWGLTSLGHQQNRIPDASREGGYRLDYGKPAREWVAPYMAQRGHALLNDGWNVGARFEFETPPGLRFLQIPVGDLYEDYLLLGGPTRDEALIHAAVDAGPPHWTLGALLRVDDRDLPEDNAVIDEEALLKDVLGVFMRMAGYDGYLIWRADTDVWRA